MNRIRTLTCPATIAATIAATVVSISSSAHAQAQVSNQAANFERNLQQIRQDTIIRANEAIPPDQRVTLDYGGYVSFGYLSLDDNVGHNHGLRQTEVFGYARANFDQAHEFFLRYRTGYRDFNQGDSFDGRGSQPIDGDIDAAYYRFDLQHFLGAYKGIDTNNDLSIKVGRDLAYWANGLVLSEPIDGGFVDAIYGPLTLSVLGGVTPVRTIDFDSSRPDFDFNTRRGFYGGMATLQVGQQRPFVYGLVQRDYNQHNEATIATIPTKFDYNSFYIGAGSAGPLNDRLQYSLETAYEGGQSISNSEAPGDLGLMPIDQKHDDIQAWAADLRLDYLPPGDNHTHYSAEGILASGDPDRQNTTTTFQGNRPGTDDLAFNGFGLVNTGLAFAPSVSNLMAFRVGASTFPFTKPGLLSRVQLGSDVFLFNKLRANANIDEPSNADHPDRRYLGWEPDVYLNWQITSDVTFDARYGLFFNNSDALQNTDNRQFLFLQVTYSF